MIIKRPVIHQYQLRILQWNSNGIHREIPLLKDLFETIQWTLCASKGRICSQKTRLLSSDTSVLSDVLDQSKGSEREFYYLHSKTDSLQNQLPTGHQLKQGCGKKWFVLDWRKGNLGVYAVVVVEQLIGCGQVDDESLTQAYRSFCKAVLADAEGKSD